MSKTILLLSEIEKESFPYSKNKNKLVVLKNCIDTDEIPKDLPDVAKGNIIFMGRIEEQKGIFEIVRALKSLIKKRNDFHFHLCGTGVAEDEIISLLNDYLPHNYTYHGVVSGIDKWRLISEAEIFLLPSWWEGLPMALLEAMFLNTVPIISNDPSMSLLIRSNENGFLVPKRDFENLERKIEYVLDDSALSEKLRMNAKKTYTDNFNLEKYYDQINEIYSGLLNNKS